MNRKLPALLMAAVLGTSTIYAQEYEPAPKKKGSLLGFSFNMTDFYTPNVIKASSLGHVLSHGGGTRVSDMDPGISVMYWKGLTNILDLSVRYNGLFTSYTKDNNSDKSYANEFEGSLHLRPLADNHLIQPFITGGIGVGQYGKTWAPYAPAGLGIQFNFSSITYLFLQANYRISLDKSSADDNLFYSLGITENLTKRKVKEVKVVPLPVVEKKDRDNDGVVDSLDACPDVAGLPQFNGCPDTDGDGIPDKDDKCPTVAGLARYQGCPIPDTDGDGINDEEDKCPTVAGVARYQGCPIPDRDKDGVNDEEDKCPDLPGPASNNGCPEVKEEVRKRVEVAASKIFFVTGSAKLMAKSYKSLDEVAKLMQDDANLKLSIDGHTDNTGRLELNQKLSADRARSVRDYLVSKGIEGGRLRSSGHGPDNPIADNKTAAGRAKNRRVEMTLTYWTTTTN
ncbi:MAG: OmpA family protein [Chitinophagaceae bacterium]